MKIRRYKKVSKSISFYANNFKFRKPYQLLVDGTFCYTALNNKINISNDITKYLQSEIKLITTPCSIIEMEKLGPKLNGALLILKQYVVHKCGHESKNISGSACILSMVSNENSSHYFVCTQDRDLQSKIRNLPGVPLLYLHMKTPILENPSKISLDKAQEKVRGLNNTVTENVITLKEKEGIVENGAPIKPKKKKKKGPNPLSCKKKQKKTESGMIQKKISKTDEEKRKRKRIRMPNHVREEMLKRTLNKINPSS